MPINEELEETARFIMDVMNLQYGVWLDLMNSTDNIIMHRTWWLNWYNSEISWKVNYLNDILRSSLIAADLTPVSAMTVRMDLVACIQMKIMRRVVQYELSSMSKIGRGNTIFAV